MQEQVLEYFEAYFGQHLNESTSDEEIMDAVYDLIDLTEAVLESVGLNEISLSLARQAETMRKVRTLSNPSQKGIEQSAKNEFYADQKNQRLKKSGLVDAGDRGFVNAANRKLGAAKEMENLERTSPYRAKQAKDFASDEGKVNDFNKRVRAARIRFAKQRGGPGVRWDA